jgi:hypothetical protein
MDVDKFEQDLKRASMRPVPAHWRSDILAAALEAQANSQVPTRAPEPVRWGVWLWFRRLAWGGLAAAWVVIFTLNWAANRPGGHGAVESIFSPEVLAVALRQSQQIASGLDGGGVNELRPPSVQRPRSDLSVRVRVV